MGTNKQAHLQNRLLFDCELRSLVGHTILVAEEVTHLGEDWVRLVLSDGREIYMGHFRNCCEDLHLRDGGDELAGIVGGVIYSASKRENSPSATVQWTYYVFDTSKGSITLAWEGESVNYSTEVDVFELRP